MIGARGHLVLVPQRPIEILERAIASLPHWLGVRVARAPVVRHLLGAAVVARK